MVEIATYDDLTGFIEKNKSKVFNSESYTTFNTFLSHSSTDKKFLDGIKRVLEGHGATIYTDDIDNRLPEKPNPQTAQILKDSINDCRRFVLFVTPNSKDSIWIPWELGLADGEKGFNSVALFPCAEKANEVKWTEQEYLGLYRRIVWGTLNGEKEPSWLVFNHYTDKCEKLSSWIKG